MTQEGVRMRFLSATGQITPDGLFKALRDVAAILYIVYQVLAFLIRLIRSYQE